MTEPIRLTRAERSAAVEALRETRTDDFGYGFGTALDRIMGAINSVRVGDPEGTIRRDPQTGWVAIRAILECALIDCKRDEPTLSWHYITSDGARHHCRSDDCSSAKDIATWPVIYRPEAS